MDVEAAADELYGIAPEAFTARRAELAAQAKRDGDAGTRAAITALRRPTVSAWAVNLLVRERGRDVGKLLELAGRLRSAQAGLRGQQLRDLSGERHAAVTELTKAAGDLAAGAGRPLRDDALNEVRATLDAAVADENAERALRSGRLTTSLHYSGFGEVDISDAVAAADAQPRLRAVAAADDRETGAQKSSTRSGKGSGGGSGKASATRRRTAPGTESAGSAADTSLADARGKLDAATDRRDELMRDVEAQRRRLRETERELAGAEAAVRAARRKLEAAERRARHT